MEKIGVRAFYRMTVLNRVTTTDAEGKVIDFGYGKKVHLCNRTIDIFHVRVYNLNGQYVGVSLEGLPKGIYIAGGKKYILK